MKIVFLASVEFGGGAERVVTLIANGLFDRKHEVEFITYDECESGYNLNSKIKITRVIPEKEKSLFRGFRYRKRLRSAIKEINPDVVIAFSAMGGILSIWSLLLTSIPVIVTVVPADNALAAAILTCDLEIYGIRIISVRIKKFFIYCNIMCSI